MGGIMGNASVSGEGSSPIHLTPEQDMQIEEREVEISAIEQQVDDIAREYGFSLLEDSGGTGLEEAPDYVQAQVSELLSERDALRGEVDAIRGTAQKTDGLSTKIFQPTPEKEQTKEAAPAAKKEAPARSGKRKSKRVAAQKQIRGMSRGARKTLSKLGRSGMDRVKSLKGNTTEENPEKAAKAAKKELSKLRKELQSNQERIGELKSRDRMALKRLKSDSDKTEAQRELKEIREELGRLEGDQMKVRVRIKNLEAGGVKEILAGQADKKVQKQFKKGMSKVEKASTSQGRVEALKELKGEIGNAKLSHEEKEAVCRWLGKVGEDVLGNTEAYQPGGDPPDLALSMTFSEIVACAQEAGEPLTADGIPVNQPLRGIVAEKFAFEKANERAYLIDSKITGKYNAVEKKQDIDALQERSGLRELKKGDDRDNPITVFGDAVARYGVDPASPDAAGQIEAAVAEEMQGSNVVHHQGGLNMVVKDNSKLHVSDQSFTISDGQSSFDFSVRSMQRRGIEPNATCEDQSAAGVIETRLGTIGFDAVFDGGGGQFTSQALREKFADRFGEELNRYLSDNPDVQTLDPETLTEIGHRVYGEVETEGYTNACNSHAEFVAEGYSRSEFKGLGHAIHNTSLQGFSMAQLHDYLAAGGENPVPIDPSKGHSVFADYSAFGGTVLSDGGSDAIDLTHIPIQHGDEVRTFDLSNIQDAHELQTLMESAKEPKDETRTNGVMHFYRVENGAVHCTTLEEGDAWSVQSRPEGVRQLNSANQAIKMNTKRGEWTDVPLNEGEAVFTGCDGENEWAETADHFELMNNSLFRQLDPKTQAYLKQTMAREAKTNDDVTTHVATIRAA